MRFVTYRPHEGTDRRERVGVLEGDEVIDIRAASAETGLSFSGSLLDLLAAGRSGMGIVDRSIEQSRRMTGARIPVDKVDLLAPLPRPTSIRDFMLVEEHVLNSFGEVPAEWYEIPAYWKGNCDSVIGPEVTVPWPHYTDQLDFELEVAAVIGERVFRVSEESASQYIAGYTIFNDWSARDIQFREMKVGLGPGLGKDFATSMGPCLVTSDSIDIGSARMTARINGELWSEGTLGTMRFSFAEVVSHLSQEQVLYPGDVLGSGTVARGCGLELDRWIAPGDVVELEVEGIGVLRNLVGSKRVDEEAAVGDPAIVEGNG